VQRAHQQGVRAFPGRVRRGEGVEIGDQPGGVGPGPQLGLGAVLAGGQAQLVEPGRGGHRERQVREVGERVATPQLQRGAQVLGRRVGPPVAQRVAAGPGQPLEADRVDGVGRQVQAVAAGEGAHRVGVGERIAQPGHQRVQRVAGAGAGRPERVGQGAHRHRAPGVQGEPGQQRAHPRTAQHHRGARGPDLQRPEDAHVHAATLPVRRRVRSVCDPCAAPDSLGPWNDLRTSGPPRWPRSCPRASWPGRCPTAG
jgi:hypothetical protein